MEIIITPRLQTGSHVIYKYPLEPKTTLELPVGARVLCVQMQQEKPTLWVLQLVNNDAEPKDVLTTEMRSRYFAALATGEQIDMKGDEIYIGTVQFQQTGLVFHIWECFPQKEGE